MKFSHARDACRWAQREISRTGLRHTVEPTRYFSLVYGRFIPCFTVILRPGRADTKLVRAAIAKAQEVKP